MYILHCLRQSGVFDHCDCFVSCIHAGTLEIGELHVSREEQFVSLVSLLLSRLMSTNINLTKNRNGEDLLYIAEVWDV